MQNLFLYAFQIIASCGILYGYYHVFLRNKKFHQYNRYYLLMTVVISLIVPFLKIPVYFSNDEGSAVTKALLQYNYYLMPEVVISSASKRNLFQWEFMLLLLYALTALFLMFKIGTAITRLIKLKIQNPSEKWNSVLFIQTDESDTPFSFFKWIFWNRNIDSLSDEGQKIMKHEMYHVAQKHSFDILFIEIVTAILWFNPFYHLIKKELKAIHEFLADSHAAGDNENLEYAEILVLHAIGTSRQTLVNPFFNNQLKRRINMLTTNKKSGSQYLRKLLALPILVIISGLFIISCKSKDEKIENFVNDTEVFTKKPEVTIDSATSVPGTENNVQADPTVFSMVDIDAVFPGGPSAWRKFLETNLRGETPVDHGAGEGNYTTIVQFIVDKDGTVSDVIPLTKMGFGMEEEAVRVIKKSGKWKPAIQNGRIVRAYHKQPITFQILKQ